MSTVPQTDPLIGVELGGFRVSRRLAEGGMGIVYEAVHDAIGRRAAVKVLKPEVATDEEWTRRFLTEARALGSLKHRNLVEVLNFGKTPDGREFLMMEFLDGEPLDAALAEHGAMAPHVALGIADQIANGLSEAHKKGIVHRDLKPSNVHLVREHNGETLVKLLDFGLARQDPIALTDSVAPRAERASLLAGTPEYIAPEQAQGKPVEASADLYSLGVMLYEMLAGRRPFEGTDVRSLLVQHLTEAPPPLSQFVNNLPEGLDTIVESLLAKDPAERPPSADALRVELQRVLKRLALEQTSVRPRPTKPSTRRIEPVATGDLGSSMHQARTWAPVLLGAAVVIAVGLAFGLSRREATTPEALPTVARPPEPLPPLPNVSLPLPLEPVPVPEQLEPLAPVVRVPVEPRRSRVVATCEPTAEWKTRLTLDIAEMGNVQRVLNDPALYERWDQRQGSLSTQIGQATTAAQCVSAQAAYDKLRAQLGFR